jgi:response regulator RpfG family c-di-GMP phosphodiesterase
MFDLKAIAIDDSKSMLLLEKKYLESLDIEVEVFTNPIDGIRHVRENEIDIVLVDYVMPEMNGVDVIKTIRTFNLDVQIIMITSIGDNDLKLKALEAGATEFLNKPLLEAEFIARIRNLGRIRAQHAFLEDEALLLQNEVQRQIKKIKNRELETLDMLAHVSEFRDENTYQHVKRVAEYSRILARGYGLDIRTQDVISKAAPLHDIGKIGIRDNILLNNDKLSDEEFAIMKQHPNIGNKILSESNSPYLSAGALIALDHHERWDGAGYPSGKKGEEISLYGRIVAVADVFDALTAQRPYKKPWSLAEAMEFIIENSGKIFDPKIVDVFLENYEFIFEYYEETKSISSS